MATVYVLRNDDYDNQQVIDIYATREAAEQEIVRAALGGHGYSSVTIDEHEPRTEPRSLSREEIERRAIAETEEHNAVLRARLAGTPAQPRPSATTSLMVPPGTSP